MGHDSRLEEDWAAPVPGAHCHFRLLTPGDSPWVLQFFRENQTHMHLDRDDAAITKACNEYAGVGIFTNPRDPSTIIACCLWRSRDLIGTDLLFRINQDAEEHIDRLTYMFAATIKRGLPAHLLEAAIRIGRVYQAAAVLLNGEPSQVIAGFFDERDHWRVLRAGGFWAFRLEDEHVIDSDPCLRVLWKRMFDAADLRGQAHRRFGLAWGLHDQVFLDANSLSGCFVEPLPLMSDPSISLAGYDASQMNDGYVEAIVFELAVGSDIARGCLKAC